MISRLRRRLTLLVIGVLAVVTAGIVLSIYAVSLRNIDSSAQAALQILTENKGRRPELEGMTPPAKPDGETPPAMSEEEETPPERPEDMRFRGRWGFGLGAGGSSLASLSNAYTIRLDADGGVSLSEKDAKLQCDATGKSVKLGAKEYQLMELFLRNPGQILPKETLIERVWGYDSDAEYNNLEVYVSFLRKKLGFIGAKAKLKATRGLGYSLEAEA
jgi:hypothetical protein